MALNSQNTTRWAFDMRSTDLATNTALGTATRHDFAAQTLYFPELTRSFAKADGGRVMVKITALLTGAVATDLDGIRIGVKINAVAFDDLDVTYALANSGNIWHIEAWRDITDYFAANDPGTANFTCQVGAAFATGAVSQVNAITAELFTTYAYDSAASTYARTAVFPIQSHASTPVSTSGASYSEIGTDATAPAPTNQIPKLTGSGGEFENVTGFTLRKRYLLIYSVYNSTSVTTYPNTVRIRFDGGGSVTAWPVCGAQVATSNKYIWILDITALSTSAPHSFEVSTSVASSQEHIGALDIVTYEYTASSTQQFVSVLLPISNESSYVRTSSQASADRYTVSLEIPEGSPSMRQSGLFLVDHFFSSGGDTLIAASGQTARTYDRSTISSRDCAPNIIHRCDHSSSTWALARGINNLYFDLWLSSVQATSSPVQGYAILNYRCTKHSDGAHKHNRTILAAQLFSYVEGTNITQTPDEPAIPSSEYCISGAMVQLCIWHSPSSQHFQVGAKRLSGEFSSAGWERRMVHNGINFQELGSNTLFTNVTAYWRRHNLTTIGMNVEAERDWNIGTTLAANGRSANLWLTYHSCTFTVTGTIKVENVAVANGKTVKIFAVASDGSTELVTSVLTTGGTGTFTAEVPDNSRTYFVSYVDGTSIGRSIDGIPESSDFSINIGLVNEAVPPIITTIALPTTPDAALVVSLYDAVGLTFYHITCKDRSDGPRLSIWDPLDGFAHPFNGKSTKTGSGTTVDPFVFIVYRRGGWPSGISLDVKVRGVDFAGNQVAS
jgi:hypothetical protein